MFGSRKQQRDELTQQMQTMSRAEARKAREVAEKAARYRNGDPREVRPDRAAYRALAQEAEQHRQIHAANARDLATQARRLGRRS